MPCSSKYPHQRYSQLNLIPIHKFGTIEFRAHSATYDIERVMRWTQFLVAFVEYFGHGKGARSIVNAYSKQSADEDYHRLQNHQEKATLNKLVKELTGYVDPHTLHYYGTRTWEIDDKSCTYPKTPQLQVVKNCLPGGPDRKTFVHARFVKQTGSEVTMKIMVPTISAQQIFYTPREYTTESISVLLPNGYTWKAGVTYKYEKNRHVYEPQSALFVFNDVKLKRGNSNSKVFYFTYDPQKAAVDFSEEELEIDNRCCCIGERCVWFPEDFLNNGHCPTLKQNTYNPGMCVSKKSCNVFTMHVNKGCVKALHSRRRTGPTRCSLKRDTFSFFNGTRC